MVVAGAAVNDATVPVNADTLGGRPANDYVTDEEVVYYSGDIAIDETVPLNADTLQGYKASDFATADWVKSEIANAQLGGGSGEGEIDLSGFALKTDVSAEINNKISNIDYPVDSVNGKIGDITLSAADVGATSMTLLWENASPTSNFASQTISMDLSEYDAIMLLTRRSRTVYDIGFGISVLGHRGFAQNLALYTDVSAGAFICGREFTPSASGILISGGVYKFSNLAMSGCNFDDAYAIPYRIYGIKGVTA